MFFHITYDDGKNKHAVALKLRTPPPEPGAVLVVVKAFDTPSHSYNVGDELALIERTQEAPHHILCSLGNWVVECKYETSIWSNIEWAIKEGILKPKTVTGVQEPEYRGMPN